MSPKYSVVGGYPVRSYTGTQTFACLNVVGTADTIHDAAKIVNKEYHNCGGLILVIDLETGRPVIA